MPDNKTANAKYEVGYGKPPQNTRFKPGQSGNPKGKPKGAKNLAIIVNNAIKEKVVVNENGKRKTISKLEVAVRQLVNKAAVGDQKAMMQLLPLVQIVEGRGGADVPLPNYEQDMKVLAEFLQRMKTPRTEIIEPDPSNESSKGGE